MYDMLIIEDFFSDEKQKSLAEDYREIALSLITPNQAIHAEPTPYNPLCRYHLDLALQIISDIYKIEKPTITGDRQLYYIFLLSEIAKYIKNDERNFIISRYILSRSLRYVVVELPYYITPKEFQEIQELEKLYKDLKITTSAIIHNYDPTSSCNLYFKQKNFDDDTTNSGLSKALNYLEENKCITEYQLNAPKEYKLK